MFRWDALLTQLLLFSSLLTFTRSHPNTHPLKRYCGVGEGDDLTFELRATHSHLHTNEPLENSLWNSSLLHEHLHSTQNPSSNRARQAADPLYIIDTYFHIISDPDASLPTSPSYTTDSMIAAQFSAIAVAYTGASIGFSFQGATRT